MAWSGWSEIWEFTTAAVPTTWEAWYSSRAAVAAKDERSTETKAGVAVAFEDIRLYPTRARVATAQDILLATLVDASETVVSAPVNLNTTQITTTSALLSWEII